MTDSSSGSHDVEETFRLSGDELEKSIALYRMIAFGGVSVLATTMYLARLPGVTSAAGIYFGVCFAFSFLLYGQAQKRGASTGLVFGSLLFEFLAVSMINPFLYYLELGIGTHHVAAEGAVWGRYLNAPGIILIMIVNMLRHHRVASIVGLAAGVLAYVAGIRWTVGAWELPQIIATGMVVITGVIGILAERQARKRLKIFARLNLLRRYVPSAAIDRVMGDEDTNNAIGLGGRSVTVTVLMADLRGFTALSEKCSPEFLVVQLNEYHGRMYREIVRHGGVLDKFLGDGTLAIFGLRSDPDAGAAAALACARAMLVSLEDLNADRVSRGLDPLAMGVGVHTGPVVAGNIGAPEKVQFTVIGDAVNTASRIEGLTKEVGTPVLVSSDTARRLDAGAGLVELAPMSVKGKAEPVRIFGLAGHPPRLRVQA